MKIYRQVHNKTLGCHYNLVGRENNFILSMRYTATSDDLFLILKIFSNLSYYFHYRIRHCFCVIQSNSITSSWITWQHAPHHNPIETEPNSFSSRDAECASAHGHNQKFPDVVVVHVYFNLPHSCEFILTLSIWNINNFIITITIIILQVFLIAEGAGSPLFLRCFYHHYRH